MQARQVDIWEATRSSAELIRDDQPGEPGGEVRMADNVLRPMKD